MAAAISHPKMEAKAVNRISKKKKTKGNAMNNKPDAPFMPRQAMREGPFRKFEPYIAMACKGSYLFDPATMRPMIMASTFVVAFNEARRGFEMFHYRSEVIPITYNLRQIKLMELENGKVWVENKVQDRINAIKQQVKLDEAELGTASCHCLEGTWTPKQQKEKVKELFIIPIGKADLVRERFLQIHEKSVSGYTYLFIVEGPPETAQALETLRLEFPNVMVNREDETHWRLM